MRLANAVNRPLLARAHVLSPSMILRAVMPEHGLSISGEPQTTASRAALAFSRMHSSDVTEEQTKCGGGSGPYNVRPSREACRHRRALSPAMHVGTV